MSRGKHLASNQVFSGKRETHLGENIAKGKQARTASLEMLRQASIFNREWQLVIKKSPDNFDYNTICINGETLVRYDITPPREALLLPLMPEFLHQFRTALRTLAFSDRKTFAGLASHARQQLKMRLEIFDNDSWVVQERNEWASIIRDYSTCSKICIFTADQRKASARDLQKLHWVSTIPAFAKLFLQLLAEMDKSEPKTRPAREQKALDYYQQFLSFENEYRKLFK